MEIYFLIAKIIYFLRICKGMYGIFVIRICVCEKGMLTFVDVGLIGFVIRMCACEKGMLIFIDVGLIGVVIRMYVCEKGVLTFINVGLLGVAIRMCVCGRGMWSALSYSVGTRVSGFVGNVRGVCFLGENGVMIVRAGIGCASFGVWTGGGGCD